MSENKYSGEGKTIEEALNAAIDAAKKDHPSPGEAPVSVDVESIHAEYGNDFAGRPIVKRQVTIKLSSGEQ